jgi:hypothetical protein
MQEPMRYRAFGSCTAARIRRAGRAPASSSIVQALRRFKLRRPRERGGFFRSGPRFFTCFSADGSGDAGQLRGTVDLGVVHVEAGGNAAGGDGLAQAIEKRIQSLVGIELGVRDEAAGIVECGLQENLLLAAAGTRDPGAGEFVRAALSSSSWRSVRPRVRRKR